MTKGNEPGHVPWRWTICHSKGFWKCVLKVRVTDDLCLSIYISFAIPHFIRRPVCLATTIGDTRFLRYYHKDLPGGGGEEGFSSDPDIEVPGDRHLRVRYLTLSKDATVQDRETDRKSSG